MLKRTRVSVWSSNAFIQEFNLIQQIDQTWWRNEREKSVYFVLLPVKRRFHSSCRTDIESFHNFSITRSFASNVGEVKSVTWAVALYVNFWCHFTISNRKWDTPISHNILNRINLIKISKTRFVYNCSNGLYYWTIVLLLWYRTSTLKLAKWAPHRDKLPPGINNFATTGNYVGERKEPLVSLDWSA